MNEEPRLFASAEAIRSIGARLLDRSLPKHDWTHEAHLAATLWILVERPDIAPDTDMRAIISRYNEAVGGVNDDGGGYHDTITHAFIAAIRNWLARSPADDLLAQVNGLLMAPEGARDWPLGYYSRDRLFSVEARRNRIDPDLAPMPVPERSSREG